MVMADDDRDENVAPGGDLVGVARPDVLRAAFAQALVALRQHLPEGDLRTVEAHVRTAERLARKQRRH